MPVLPPVPSPPASDRAAHRLPSVDAARGVAILAMVAYHLCWDLDHLGFVRLSLFTSPFWLGARTAILGAFLLLSGVSLALAAERGMDRRRFLRRLGLLVVAAGGVSAASYAAFPDSPIFFGVLHHIAVASVLGLAFVRVPPVLTLAAAAAVWLLPAVHTAALFDRPELLWVGLGTGEPESNDYVPLFPWFGLVLAGIAAGRLRPGRGAVAAWRPAGHAGAALAWAGRHSLAVYLVHQPVLFGALWLAAAAGGVPDAETRGFLAQCATSCVQSGGSGDACSTYCRCVADGLKRDGLWADTLANRLRGDGPEGVARIVASCAPGRAP